MCRLSRIRFCQPCCILLSSHGENIFFMFTRLCFFLLSNVWIAAFPITYWWMMISVFEYLLGIKYGCVCCKSDSSWSEWKLKAGDAHWKNYISISFQIEWDMIVMTIFLSFLNQMVQPFWIIWFNTERKTVPRSHPIQFERKWKHNFLSTRVIRHIYCLIVCHKASYNSA